MNTLLKILIVEDEILIADYIEELLKELDQFSIQQANTKEEAVKSLRDFFPDIVLMDINLEGNNEGIDLANNEFSNEKLIFLTAQNDSDTVKKAIATKPLGYLTKPIKRTDLLATIQLGINSIFSQKEITVKHKNVNIKIPVNSIMFAKKEDHYLKLFTKDKPKMLRASVKEFLEMVNSSDFIQVHRSYVVNKKYVNEYSVKEIFIEGERIPISSTYVKGILDQLQ